MNTLNKYFLAGCVFMLCACKKETSRLPYNQITSFVIPDADGKSLAAAVSGQDIIVYWPFGQAQPAEVSPQITVTEKATVKPASGEKISFNGDAIYTVTAESGATATYRLKIVSNQPVPVIRGMDGGSEQIGPGGTLYTGHLYLLQDKSRNKISLISKSGEQLPCIIKEITRDRFAFQFPAKLDTGRYNLQITSGNYTTIVKKIFLYRLGNPELYDYGQLTVKRGQTFTVNGNYISVVTKAVLYLDFSRSLPIEVVGNTATTITLRIPQNFPVGTCQGGMLLTNTYYNITDDFGLDVPVTITE